MTAGWLPVPGWAGYEVSSDGRVRSVARVLSDGRRAGGVELTQRRDRDGYWRVSLSDGRRQRTVRVHVLVAQAHRGKGNGQVRHLDDERDNNTVGNLRFGSRKQNDADKRKNRKERAKQDGTATGLSAQRCYTLFGWAFR